MPTNRRNFLKTAALSAAVVTTGVVGAPRVHAAGGDEIRVALIGCGGRGRGACFQALNTEGPVKLVAVADAFEDQAKGFAQLVKAEKGDRCALSDDSIFWGMDSYKKAIDCLNPGDVALLVAPPAFRALHFEYAVERGVHIFLEKPFGVDTPTIKRSLAAWKKAKEKGLKIITGLNNRKYIRTEETVKRIQDGAIGDILSCWVYRLQQHTCGYNYHAEWTPLQNQLRNYNSFTWISGSPTVDWMVHNIDICCWAKGEHPIWCQGMGGRQVRDLKDEVFDHITTEYQFADGVKMLMQVRHLPNTWTSFRSVIQGSKGMAIVGEGIGEPRIFKGYRDLSDDVVWKSDSPRNDSYQEEHHRLFRMIREDIPCEDVEFCIQSNFIGVMGRMAMESGQELAYDTAWNSTYELCPNLDNLKFDDPGYIMPNEDGTYTGAKQGFTKRF
ncbi:MAG: Gfo/Idh/MocA family oxidoreductase [Planctomycetia bacterium]|nr:Gfo/Idh/MocA family oxidoreductase [Planctomycetia bacterium]